MSTRCPCSRSFRRPTARPLHGQSREPNAEAGGCETRATQVSPSRGAPEGSAREHPRPEDVTLIVEVADSSLAYDLGEKKIAYVRSGIPEYWVVDIPNETVHVFRGANRFAEGYLHESLHNAEETLGPREYSDVAVPIARILGLDAEKEGPTSA
jgi:Uma2 family endonuclease